MVEQGGHVPPQALGVDLLAGHVHARQMPARRETPPQCHKPVKRKKESKCHRFLSCEPFK